MTNRGFLVCAVLAAVVLAFVAGYAIAHARATHASPMAEAEKPPAADDDATPGAAADEPPLIHVTLRAVGRQALATTLAADGVVIAAPATRTSVSLAVDVIIESITVSLGSAVTSGETVGMVRLTPGGINARAQALLERDAARGALTLTTQRYELAMASALELQQAQQALELATVKLALWNEHLTGERFALRASASGVVESVGGATGAVVGAGSEILGISGASQELRLGLEPAQARLVHAGTVLAISDPRQPGLLAHQAHVDLISSILTPDTHLQDAVVHLPGLTFPAGEMVHATLAVTLPEALVVPRSTVLLQEQAQVFTVAHGHAQVHTITILGQAGGEVAVHCQDLTTSDQVIVLGDDEITDGCLVQVDPTP